MQFSITPGYTPTPRDTRLSRNHRFPCGTGGKNREYFFMGHKIKRLEKLSEVIVLSFLRKQESIINFNLNNLSWIPHQVRNDKSQF